MNLENLGEAWDSVVEGVGQVARVVALPAMLAVTGCGEKEDHVANARNAIDQTVAALEATGHFRRISCESLDIDNRKTTPAHDAYVSGQSTTIQNGVSTTTIVPRHLEHKNAETTGEWSGESFSPRSEKYGKGRDFETSVCVGLIDPIQRRDHTDWTIHDMEAVLYRDPPVKGSGYVDVGADWYVSMEYGDDFDSDVGYFYVFTLNTKIKDFPKTVMHGFPCLVVGEGDTRLTGGQPCKEN